MDVSKEFECHMAHLAQGRGHADRRTDCTGLMLPLARSLARRSLEPMVSHVDPLYASAKRQALHHFVAKVQWSARA